MLKYIYTLKGDIVHMKNTKIINFESGIKRFVGSKELFLQCLKKFTQDNNYNKLVESINNKTYKEAFEYAHTLKGLCGNLSLELLYNSCCNIVEDLRHNEYQNLNNLLSDLSLKYNKTLKEIHNIVK